MRDLPWKKNAVLVTHAIAATTTTTLFLLQMATLVASINAYFGERVVLLKTYMRSTSKKEAAARARYEGNWKSKRGC
jgi:hypothetical protein